MRGRGAEGDGEGGRKRKSKREQRRGRKRERRVEGKRDRVRGPPIGTEHPAAPAEVPPSRARARPFSCGPTCSARPSRAQTRASTWIRSVPASSPATRAAAARRGAVGIASAALLPSKANLNPFPHTPTRTPRSRRNPQLLPALLIVKP
eukprot:2350996-Pleurochrysis_carterae.AAC.7